MGVRELTCKEVREITGEVDPADDGSAPDTDLVSWKIGTVRKSGNTAEVEVTTVRKEHGTETSTYNLVKEDGAWKVCL